MTNKPYSTLNKLHKKDKQSANETDFFFSEIIGTPAAGPAGPVPATLLAHAQLERKIGTLLNYLDKICTSTSQWLLKLV